ncbi:TPA: transcription antitermination factor NusB [Candidatus Gracilibacteria bacterium]|nr:transcription antitermination factor NusB [Candidatus Peregrinibacteria bacterium]HIQ56651.1 transcription antitermination factor NusB [Candidatus Gracilibacteria bacterium]HIQ57657.1 transcription antitermination factor NusB [Candidatus Gracilibacteria bacterium]
MSIRHKARSAAVQVLSSVTWRNTVLTDDVNKTIENIKEEFFPQTRENEFFESLVFGVIKNRTAIDELIQGYAPKFKVVNLSAIDRVIMEMGMYEMIHTTTPGPIIINECVELAKEFGDEGTPKFVNGVLSTHFRKIEELQKEEV